MLCNVKCSICNKNKLKLYSTKLTKLKFCFQQRTIKYRKFNGTKAVQAQSQVIEKWYGTKL